VPTYPVYVDDFGCRHTGTPDELGRLKVEASAIHRDGFFAGGISTPSDASMFVTDLDVRIRLKADTWHTGFTQWFVSHGAHTVNTLAWAFTQHANGAFRTAISADGTNFLGPESSVPFDRPDGTEQFIRTTVDTDIGGGLLEFKYFWSDDLGVTWQQLGDTLAVTGAPLNLFNSGAALTIPGGTAQAAGAYYELDWRASIDGPSLVYADFTHLAPEVGGVGGIGSFVGETGEVWTLNGVSVFNPVIVGKCQS
jgi:hypothetical protein